MKITIDKQEHNIVNVRPATQNDYRNIIQTENGNKYLLSSNPFLSILINKQGWHKVYKPSQKLISLIGFTPYSARQLW
jgi:hypothetical protein